MSRKKRVRTAMGKGVQIEVDLSIICSHPSMSGYPVKTLQL
jgi:hypothetical protein